MPSLQQTTENETHIWIKPPTTHLHTQTRWLHHRHFWHSPTAMFLTGKPAKLQLFRLVDLMTSNKYFILAACSNTLTTSSSLTFPNCYNLFNRKASKATIVQVGGFDDMQQIPYPGCVRQTAPSKPRGLFCACDF